MDKSKVAISQKKPNEKSVNQKSQKRARRPLRVNIKIASNKKKVMWKIMEHIGSGGFGDVYRVTSVPCSDNSNPDIESEGAMKTENVNATNRRLELELKILKDIKKYCENNRKQTHFCVPYDYGCTKKFQWIVMTLIGPSLEVIRQMLGQQFTRTTVIKMAYQILDALQTLHYIGFIHRDLKPGNVCVGCPPHDDMTLYLLDFGISRKIFRDNNNLKHRTERPRVPFFGTRKFCSRACHLERDQGRRDDAETYIYTILDLFSVEKGLPWNKVLADKDKVLKMKSDMMNDPKKELDPIVPPQFQIIIAHVRSLSFESEVNYGFIENQLADIVKTEGIRLGDTFDWQGKLEMLIKTNRENKARIAEDKMREGKRSDDVSQPNSGDGCSNTLKAGRSMVSANISRKQTPGMSSAHQLS